MRTLIAQRLRKQTELENKNRAEMIRQLFEEARAEMETLSGLMDVPEGIMPLESPRKTLEKYREDDEDSYFEQGILER
jgi:predicted DNA-binding protein